MAYFLAYIFLGLLIYPSTMDMWYRICYKRGEFPEPSAWMYGGFLLIVFGWILLYPKLTIDYFKEMTK